MAQLLLATAGAALGNFILPGIGGQIGWALGATLGSAFGPQQKIKGPRLDDLKATGVDYGSPIPRVFGTVRTAGQIWWASDKRERAKTHSAGKGGGPEYTEYTYSIDLMVGLCDGPIDGVTRIWKDKKLIWTRLSGASAASLAASTDNPNWARLTEYRGTDDQLPDPTYEAAVGSANAVGYRGRSYVMIEGLELGSSGQLPYLEFEVATNGQSVVQTAVERTAQTVVAPFNVGTAAASQSTVFRVHVGQWTNTYTTTLVKVYDVDLLADTRTPVGSYNVVNATWNAAGGYSDVDGMMQMNGTSARLWDSSGGYIDFTLPYTGAGNTNGRFCRNGGYVVIGHRPHVDGGGSGRVYAFTTAGGGAYASSANYYDGVNAILVVGAYVYLAFTNTKVVYRLNLADLTFVDSINRPGFSAPVADQWPVLFEIDGTCGLICDSGSGTKVYALRSGAWQEIGALGSSLVQSSNRGQSVGVVGNLLVGAYVRASTTDYKPWYAPLVIDPQPVPLEDVVSDLCEDAGLTAAQIDVTDLASSAKDVRAFAVAQVAPTRAALEALAASHFFDCRLRDKLVFFRRATATSGALAYADLGASAGQAQADAFAPRLANDLELAAQMAVRYINMSDDQQPGIEYSDRIVTGQAATATVDVPVGLTPAEAKGVADVLLMDQLAGAATATVSTTLAYAAVEPGDVRTVYDAAGRAWRMRVVRRQDAGGVLTLDLVSDDDGALVSAQTTSTDYTPATTVTAPSDTVLEALDVPLLRDADDGPVWYAAVRGATATWPGAVVLRSTDDVTFETVAEVPESGVLGTCTTTLGNWSGGNVMDLAGSVTVNVGPGQLASTTRAALLADDSVNAMLIGSEIIQFQTATLQSPGVYKLTGLLRGRRGTEWAMTGHAANERCVLLRQAGLRPVRQSAADVGRQYYLRGVTRGAVADDVDSEAFTFGGESIKPLSPVQLRQTTISGGAVTVTWTRRTRLATRLCSPAGISAPLGEASERYLVRMLDGSTLVSEQIATSATCTFASGAVAGYTVTVQQVSDIYGPGRAASLTLV